MKVVQFILVIFILMISYLYIDVFSSYVLPWKQKEAIQSALIWGGLNDMPKNSEIIAIEKRGSMFTRQYIISFKSNKSDIQNWVQKSKRLKNNLPKKIGNNLIYSIVPGEKKSYGGKVEIKNDTVTINMSWS